MCRILLLVLVLMGCAPERPEYRENAPTRWSVVLVTFDGLRWQELFDGVDPLLSSDPAPVFPRFWSEVAPRGTVYGDPAKGHTLRVATASNASLPGYMSIYGETPQGCVTNGCGPIGAATFVDRLHDELAWRQEEVQVLAAWNKLDLAVSARDDVAKVVAGGFEPDIEGQDPAFDFDSGPVRDLAKTLAPKPRFFHLALLDSDRYGHQGRYEKYLDVLRAYDRLLAELVPQLDDQTALIVTTDHGRGLMDQWSEHGPQVPSSARVWAFVMLPRASTLSTVAPGARAFDHHDVRYTIETLFGLSTTSTSGYSTGFIASP